MEDIVHMMLVLQVSIKQKLQVHGAFHPDLKACLGGQTIGHRARIPEVKP
jgi:hypothetical protein